MTFSRWNETSPKHDWRFKQNQLYTSHFSHVDKMVRVLRHCILLTYAKQKKPKTYHSFTEQTGFGQPKYRRGHSGQLIPFPYLTYLHTSGRHGSYTRSHYIHRTGHSIGVFPAINRFIHNESKPRKYQEISNILNLLLFTKSVFQRLCPFLTGRLLILGSYRGVRVTTTLSTNTVPSARALPSSTAIDHQILRLATVQSRYCHILYEISSLARMILVS